MKLSSVANEFQRAYGVDPSPVIRLEYMPDEVSEPEDSTISSLEWKKKVAPAAGYEIDKLTAMSDDSIRSLQVLEIVKPAFCSDKVS